MRFRNEKTKREIRLLIRVALDARQMMLAKADQNSWSAGYFQGRFDGYIWAAKLRAGK